MFSMWFSMFFMWFSMFFMWFSMWFSVWLQALGSWVLVGSVTDEKTGLLPQVSNSFMELSLSEDNSSFVYIERNKFRWAGGRGQGGHGYVWGCGHV